MKVQLLNKISPEGLKHFDASMYETGDNFDDYDAILVRSASLHEMEFPQSLKCIARAGAGVNNIPLQRCSEQGIVVFNTPGANANAVKELTIAGLLLASRKIVKGIEWVKTLDPKDIAKTVEKGKSQFAGPEVMGKKLGVIGLGAIGVQVANAAAALGMDVYGYDPYISVNAAWTLKARIHHITQLKTIFEECDYITLHLPLLDSTRGMLNEEAFAQMKDGVRIVNFARDGLIEQDALISAIENGKVAAFVTDFADEKLLHLEQVIITPHLGASTPESEDNCARMAVEETREYLETGNIRNSVNMPALSLEPNAQNRICIINRNVPNMVAKISSQLGQYGINIETMANKARGEYAYTIVETNDTIDELSIEGIRSSEGIINVRVIQQTA